MNRKHLRILLIGAFLGLAGCAGTSVGRACTQRSDCETGQECYAQAPGGFCSKGCSAEGSFAECPGNTLCTQNAGLLLCAPICTDHAECRPEYECVGVASSNQKACRPKAKI